MKTLICVIMAAALLAGCSKPDPKVAELEKRVDLMQKRFDVLYDGVESLGKIMAESESNSVADWTRIESALQEKSKSDQEFMALVFQHIADTNIHRVAPVRVSTSYYQSPAASFTQGIPTAIYNQIATEAVRKWQTDYEMQNYEIKKQVEAYKKLHGQ